MADQLLSYFDKNFSLTEEEKQALADIPVREYPRGSIIIREGQVCVECFFILKGCIRQYYLMDGEEKTAQFFTEFQPVFSSEGFQKKKPSDCYYACVEDTVVVSGTLESEHQLFALFPRFETMSRIVTEENLSMQQKQWNGMIIRSPEDRYLHLLKTRPDLLQRVPQHQLASFIGIKPESLSRIKKRIANKQRKHPA